MKHKWIVCIKQVAREPIFKRVEDSFQVDRESAEGVFNPCDHIALDVALEMRARAGGQVIAVSMGPPRADEVLREALTCGADRAVLLSDPAFAGSDTLATARTLAAAIRKLGDFSLVLCGSRTMDSDTGQVGPQLAEFLGVPMASNVDRVAFRKNGIRAERRIDGFREKLEIPFPALIAVERQKKRGMATSLKEIEKAFGSVHVARWTRDDLELDSSEVGLQGSATRARDFATWEKKRSGQIVEGGPEEVVDRILSIILDRNIL